MRKWCWAALELGLPLATACLVVLLERPITELAARRPGILPVAMVALLIGLLIVGVRRWLIVTLCFGIGVMAIRDTFRLVPLPAQIDYVLVNALYPIGWAMLAALAIVAAGAEALKPGTVWARRCYFAAATLYLTGHGLISYLRKPTWEALILLGCGAVSFVGLLGAHRIVQAEAPPEPEPEDIQAMDEHMRQRAARVSAKEWR